MDGVRALAILTVFFGHALHAKGLWIGVDVFFALSGFLITGILLDTKKNLLDANEFTLSGYFSRFYSRRARRILAPYLLFLLFGSIAFGVAWMHHWYFYLLLTNLLDPLGIARPEGFTPLWSLAVEEQFYLAWPFAVVMLSPRSLKKLCIALMVIAPLLRGALHFKLMWPIYALTPFRMDLLAAGGLLSLEWRERKARIEQNGTAVGLMMVSAGFLGLWAMRRLGYSTWGNTRIGNVFIYESALCLAVGTMIYALAGRRVGWLEWRPVTYIGQISYTMYLVHLSIIVLVERYLSKIAMVPVALTLTILYAALSWHFMERRLLQRKSPHVVPQSELALVGATPIPSAEATIVENRC